MGGLYSLPNVPIKDTLGKYIILTNKYPLNNFNLNSIVNGVINKNRQYIKKYNYTSRSANGLGNEIVDINKFKNNNKEYMTITIPSNMTQVNIEDCDKFGIQLSLIDMLGFKGYTNNRTYQSLKKLEKSNESLRLKPDNLRYFPPKFKPNPQNPNSSYES